jgi:hypothetical protein
MIEEKERNTATATATATASITPSDPPGKVDEDDRSF